MFIRGTRKLSVHVSTFHSPALGHRVPALPVNAEKIRQVAAFFKAVGYCMDHTVITLRELRINTCRSALTISPAGRHDPFVFEVCGSRFGGSSSIWALYT